MDYLIETNTEKIRLSSLGILVTDYKENGIETEVNQNSISGRNGYVLTKGKFTKKEITVTGIYYKKNQYEDDRMRDRLNGLFSILDPFYITKMYPAESDLYNYENPGETAKFDLLNVKHFPYFYRHKVLLSEPISFEFQGMSKLGILTKCTFNFKTAESPFGMTIPLDENLTGKNTIAYKGTAPCSQLEWPFQIKIEVTADWGNILNFTIGKRTLTYKGDNKLKKGDIISLNGFSNTLNGININDKTNCEYFILEPNFKEVIDYHCDIASNIYILNKIEFYK